MEKEYQYGVEPQEIRLKLFGKKELIVPEVVCGLLEIEEVTTFKDCGIHGVVSQTKYKMNLSVEFDKFDLVKYIE